MFAHNTFNILMSPLTIFTQINGDNVGKGPRFICMRTCQLFSISKKGARVL